MNKACLDTSTNYIFCETHSSTSKGRYCCFFCSNTTLLIAAVAVVIIGAMNGAVTGLIMVNIGGICAGTLLLVILAGCCECYCKKDESEKNEDESSILSTPQESKDPPTKSPSRKSIIKSHSSNGVFSTTVLRTGLDLYYDPEIKAYYDPVDKLYYHYHENNTFAYHLHKETGQYYIYSEKNKGTVLKMNPEEAASYHPADPDNYLKRLASVTLSLSSSRDSDDEFEYSVTKKET